MNQENTTVQYALSSLKGKPAWGLVRTHGSFFFVELGKPISRPGGVKVHGEWHFLVEMCQWRFETHESILVGSDDDQEFIDASFARLALGAIENVDATPPCHDLTVVFSSGIRLKTLFASAAAKDEWKHWYLYLPDDNAWIVGGDGRPVLKNVHA
jgi:hypothetical protein